MKKLISAAVAALFATSMLANAASHTAPAAMKADAKEVKAEVKADAKAAKSTMKHKAKRAKAKVKAAIK